VLCCDFDATNRDYRVVIAADAVDGEEMHRFALRLMSVTIGWPLAQHRDHRRARALLTGQIR